MNTSKTIVVGQEEKEVTQGKRTGRVFGIFKTEWWETVKADTIGRDIHIETQHPIRNVYLNGELLVKK